MIKRKNNYIYVKDIEVPNNLLVEFSMDINLPGSTIQGKTETIDLSPITFLKRNDVITDLFDYISYVLTEMFNKVTDGYDIKYFMSLFKEYKEDIVSLQKILLSVKSALTDRTVYCKLRDKTSLFGLFKINIKKVTSLDHEIENVLSSSKDAFKTLFSSDLYLSKNGATHTNVNPDTFFMYDFLNLLFNIFIFYVSEKNRTEKICSILKYIALSEAPYYCRSEVLEWDKNLEKYIYYCPKEKNNFKVSDLANNINVPHNMSERYTELPESLKCDGGEKYNPYERIKLEALKGACDETFITTINRSEHLIDDIEMIDAYIAYKAYNSGNNSIIGRDAAVSINVYTKHINDDYNILYNCMIYRKNVLDILYANDYYKNSKIPYSLFEEKLVRDKLCDTNYNILCDVCYFTKGRGCTFKDSKSLETAKIPKDKRDYIFEALCNLCYELDIEPQLVIDKLNVDFKRLYKKPIELKA